MLKFTTCKNSSFGTSRIISRSFSSSSSFKKVDNLLDFQLKTWSRSPRSTTLITLMKNDKNSKFLFSKPFVRYFAEITKQTSNEQQNNQQESSGGLMDTVFDGFRHLLTLFAIVGLGWCLYTVNEGKSSSTWLPIEAEILDGQVYVWSQTRPGIYGLKYRYKVDGKYYEGSRLAVGHQWIYREPIDIRVMDITSFQRGTKVTAYYNPSNPEKVTLVRGVQPIVYKMWIPVFCLIILRVFFIPKLSALLEKATKVNKK